MKKKIIIEGMSCGHCVNHVYMALDEIRAIDIKVNLEQGNAVAEVGDITDDVIKEAIEEAGYDVIGIEEV
ncbi:heavy metal transport/detoxification protein [Clostridium chromiireducens]|jgi:Copper chaperone|uniref:Heavy metal transport/detoxification protein n=1 Tax=Clostridium chromiireducens TaxID=225345 RepID=A0A964RL62_9CLOT|nr:cation transporter [Clostridium chromiireducens]MVX63687.1 heavy metal transport/detoxification protein [Clostridium chromiireducens]